MGRSIVVQWRILLPLCGLVALLVASPVGAETTIQGALQDGAPHLDGTADDDFWAGIPVMALPFDGTLRPERSRDVGLQVAHNGTHLFFAVSFTPGGGTHEADHLLVTFYDGTAAAIPAGKGDYLRYGGAAPPAPSDRHWNGTAWVSDAGACRHHGDGARAERDGTWHYELVKPIRGDGCDLSSAAGSSLLVRFELRENRPAPDHGDDFRWPAGSSYLDPSGNKNGRLDEVQGWARLHLLQAGEVATDHPLGSASATTGADGKAGADGALPAEGKGDGASGASGSSDTEGDAAEAPALPVVWLVSLYVVAFLARRRA